MITSAGCNALEYLLDRPAAIHCVDVNYRQNALLELKRASIQKLEQDDLFRLFGTGSYQGFRHLFYEVLGPELPDYAFRYWERNLRMFSEKGLRQSFYYYGSSGTFAWIVGKYLRSKSGVRTLLQKLFEAPDMESQRKIYFELEHKVLDGLVDWALNRHLTMSLVGVPRAQQKLFLDLYEKGVSGYVRSCLRKVFTELSVADNYFYRLYAFGSYTNTCCPEYLKHENIELLREELEKVRSHTMPLTSFLQNNPGEYSHFILLDHQDWLAEHAPEALDEEWRQILKNSRSGTRILLRSAAPEIDFIPDFVLDQVDFDVDRTEEQHQLDRVGTYAGICLAIVR